MPSKALEIATLRRQLDALGEQRAAIQARLDALLGDPRPNHRCARGATEVTLSDGEKIALFRRLFAGRQDVFALRWENHRDGRSGYAPACSKEWVAGICGKPKIKCGVCPNQAFIPVSDASIRNTFADQGQTVRAPTTL
jgi:hypothetical protein